MWTTLSSKVWNAWHFYLLKKYQNSSFLKLYHYLHFYTTAKLSTSILNNNISHLYQGTLQFFSQFLSSNTTKSPIKSFSGSNVSFSYKSHFPLLNFLMSSVTWFPFKIKTAFFSDYKRNNHLVWKCTSENLLLHFLSSQSKTRKKWEIKTKTSSSMKLVGIYNLGHKTWGQKMEEQ